MRAVITGASGFVGRALHDHLLDSGDDVVALSRGTGGPDLADRGAIFATFADAQPDVVYHLAAQAHVPTSWQDPVGTLRTNVEGTQNVLDAARAAGGSRVLVASSAEIYGTVTPTELPITEGAAMRPLNPYAASKVAADALAVQANLGHGQDVVRLRSFNQIGPGQSTDFVCAGLANRIALAELNGLHTIDVGSLEPRRDFSDVRDVVRAFRLAATQGEPGQAYNVCSGVDRSIRELAEHMAALSTHELEFRVREALQRPVDTPIVRGDNSRITTATGWSPKIPIETSLADILNDARLRLANDSNTDANHA